MGSTIGLGAIKLDFGKSPSGGGLMKMLRGSSGSSNKVGNDVRSSQEGRFADDKKNSFNSGKRGGAMY